jgi:phosphoenolpyruvate synthase/pyruvate phosphate dikinase
MTVAQAEASPLTSGFRPFAHLRRDDVAYAGGQGAKLGELTSAGLPVPDGFVVSAPAGLRTSICGQAPSVHPEYAELLVRAEIDAISVSVDAVERTRKLVAAAEQRVLLNAARIRA